MSHPFNKQNFPITMQLTPFIYGWFRAPNYLYIGSSANTNINYFRFVEHRVIGKKENVLPQDVLHIWLDVNYFNKATLIITEARFINTIKPKHNLQYNAFVLPFDNLTLPPITHIVSQIPLCLFCGKEYIIHGRGSLRNFCNSVCLGHFKDKANAEHKF